MKKIFSSRMKRGLFLAASMLFLPLQAHALDEIYSPNAETGELSLEYNGSRTFNSHGDKNNEQEHELALEYGAGNWWTTEVSAGFERDPGDDLRMEDVEFENRFQFFQPGEKWLDSGLLVAVQGPVHEHDPYGLEVKALLQKDVGRFTSKANIGFEQEFGNGASGGIEPEFLWSTRYRYAEYVEPGFEIQSDFGQGRVISHFSQQEHYVGPAVYGKLFGSLHYEAAYLFGVSQSSSNAAGRVLLEQEFHF